MKSKLRVVFINLIVCSLTYFTLITNELTNTYDGMWQGSFYRDYEWVTSIGRWFWPFIGFGRRHVSPEPFTSLFSILLYILGACLIISIFDLWNSWVKYLVVTGCVVNTSVLACLSYRYMSPTFAFSFFSAILPVWLIAKFKPAKVTGKAILLSLAILSVVLSLASYQANIGCFCLLIVFVLVKINEEDKTIKELFTFVLKAIIILGIGCVIYKIIWDVVLRYSGLSAAEYRGADSLSVIEMVEHLPIRIKDSYNAWLDYAWRKDNIKHNIFQNKYSIMFKGPMVILFLLMAFSPKKGEEHEKKALINVILRRCISVCLLLLLPVAENISFLLSYKGGDMMIQMSHPMAIEIMVLLCLLINRYDTLKNINIYKGIGGKYKNAISSAVFGFFIVCILYGRMIAVSVDQHEMLVSRNTSCALFNRVISDVETKGLLDDKQLGVVIIGRPSDNPLFYKDNLWDLSNGYSHYGEFWLGGDCCTQSYRGFLRDAGVNILLNPDHEHWHYFETKEEVQTMPAYPKEGYVEIIDDCLVIKLSDPVS